MTRVLFVCTGNSCRSQMAEALARHLGGGRIEASSAGTEPKPIPALTLEVLREQGADVSGLRPKGLEELQGREFNWVVTLCGEAEERCPAVAGRFRRLHWPVEDPARSAGNEAARRQAFREARDAIRARLERWLPSLLA